MEDQPFPIPKQYLNERLNPVFQVLAKNQSLVFIGVPGSGKSSYIQFCLSQPSFLKTLLPKKTNFHFVYLNPDLCPVLTSENFYKMTLSQLVKSLEKKSALYLKAKNYQEQIIFTSDYFLMVDACRKILEELTKSKRVVIIIDYFERLKDLDPKIVLSFKSFWQIARIQPIEKVSFLLLSQPKIIFDSDSSFVRGFLNLVGSNFVFCPLLSEKESRYSYHRHAKLRDYQLASTEENFLFKTIGGLGSAFRYSIQTLEKIDCKKNKDFTEFIFTNSLIKQAVWGVFESLPTKNQKELLLFLKEKKIPPDDSLLWSLNVVRKQGKQILPFGSVINILKEQKNKEHILINKGLQLTAELTTQEFNLLSYFLKNPNKVVSKDEMSQVLWGEGSFDQYSEWAINKAIDRLRRKIKSENAFPCLLTLRGRGYKLILDQDG